MADGINHANRWKDAPMDLSQFNFEAHVPCHAKKERNLKFIFLVLITVLISCQKEESPKIRYSTTLSSSKNENKGKQVSVSDEFADFKEKIEEEECADEEELEKKLLESKKAFKLQGDSEEDCTVQ